VCRNIAKFSENPDAYDLAIYKLKPRIKNTQNVWTRPEIQMAGKYCKKHCNYPPAAQYRCRLPHEEHS